MRAMRFFTSEWWDGDGDPETATAYRRHFASIQDRLPADLVRLHERYTLHDGHVRSVGMSVETGKLTLVVDTWDDANCYRRFGLIYDAVTAWRVESDGDADIADPKTWDDLGYHEVDVAGDALEHRMIFAGGVELLVRFSGFRLVIEEGPA